MVIRTSLLQSDPPDLADGPALTVEISSERNLK